MSPVAWPGLRRTRVLGRRAVRSMTGPVLRSAVLSSPVPPSRWHKIRTELSLREQGRLAAMFLLILAVNAAGWGIYVLCVMPHHFSYQGVGGSRGLGVGLGVAITAWFLGFRHAFDADHISCIDNTTRKLMADGNGPVGSGFCFSVGRC